MAKGTLKICSEGHRFYKSSDCPVCPVCESRRKPETSFLMRLGAPARRALENNGIFHITDLSRLTEKQVLAFHGMGPASLPQLRKALEEAGLAFATQ